MNHHTGMFFLAQGKKLKPLFPTTKFNTMSLNPQPVIHSNSPVLDETPVALVWSSEPSSIVFKSTYAEAIRYLKNSSIPDCYNIRRVINGKLGRFVSYVL